MKHLKQLIHVLLALAPLCAVGQKNHYWVVGDVPLHFSYHQEIERSFGRDSSSYLHLGMKPLTTRSEVIRNAVYFARDTTKYYYNGAKKLRRDHLIDLKTDDFKLGIDPLFDFALGQDLNDASGYGDTTQLLTNTRGVSLRGWIGDKVWFQTGFYESQAFLPLYLKQFADSTGVVPGMGRTKKFKESGFDYNMSFGSVSFQAKPWMMLQIGYGKHFIGHGYRSVLLSDVAFAYPYLKAELTLLEEKLRYTALASTFQNMQRLPPGEVPESLFERKGGSMYYLSYTPIRELELGWFEATVRQRVDSASVVAMTWDTYVPIIGLSTLVNGSSRKNNTVWGLNARWQAHEKIAVYAQWAVDDISDSRFGWQVGTKFFDCLLPRLDAVLEYNSTADFMYTDAAGSKQSFSHFNQPLGLASGAGVKEWVGILTYRWRAIEAQVKYNRVVQSGGAAGNWEADPNQLSQSFSFSPRELQQWDIQTSLCIHPKTNMRLTAGITDRRDRIADEQHTTFVYLGFRTNLHNRYADF
jgi:hypothetical protein